MAATKAPPAPAKGKLPPKPTAPAAQAPAAPPAPPSAPTKDVENVVPGTTDSQTVNQDPAAAEGDEAKAGGVRKSAVIAEFNFDEEMVVPPRATVQRDSKWTAVLDRLYSATEQGLVKRNEDESLKFTKIGHYLNVNGARSQIQIFKKDTDVDATYEFKTLPATQLEDEPHAGSDLWARVREIAPEDAAPATDSTEATPTA